MAPSINDLHNCTVRTVQLSKGFLTTPGKRWGVSGKLWTAGPRTKALDEIARRVVPIAPDRSPRRNPN